MYRRMLIAIDESTWSDNVLGRRLHLAKDQRATVGIVCVVDTPRVSIKTSSTDLPSTFHSVLAHGREGPL